MKCPACLKELKKSKMEKFDIALCSSCQGIWVDSFTFDEIRNFEKPFSPLLNIDIWNDAASHKVVPSEKKCPQCHKRLYEAGYGDSDITIDICPPCKAIWFDRKEMEKVFSYIDKEISEETMGDLFDELGNELNEFLTGHESAVKDIKHIGLILKLMEYKIFSRFPRLQDLANSLPL